MYWSNVSGGGAQDSAVFTSLWDHLCWSTLSKPSCRFAGATPGFLSSRDFEYSKVEGSVPLFYERHKSYCLQCSLIDEWMKEVLFGQ